MQEQRFISAKKRCGAAAKKSFCVEVYLKTKWIVMFMRAFHSIFKFQQTSSLPNRYLILLWASSFKQFLTTQKEKFWGSFSKNTRKMYAMKAIVDHFPNRSSRKMLSDSKRRTEVQESIWTRFYNAPLQNLRNPKNTWNWRLNSQKSRLMSQSAHLLTDKYGWKFRQRKDCSPLRCEMA